jgi:hypothetical protein
MSVIGDVGEIFEALDGLPQSWVERIVGHGVNLGGKVTTRKLMG